MILVLVITTMFELEDRELEIVRFGVTSTIAVGLSWLLRELVLRELVLWGKGDEDDWNGSTIEEVLVTLVDWLDAELTEWLIGVDEVDDIFELVGERVWVLIIWNESELCSSRMVDVMILTWVVVGMRRDDEVATTIAFRQFLPLHPSKQTFSPVVWLHL